MIKVNLYKPEKKDVSGGVETVSYAEEAGEGKFQPSALLAALLISVGVAAFMYFSATNAMDREQRTFDERTAQLTELEKVLQKLAESEKTKAMLDTKIKLISDLKAQQKTTVEMMDKLSRVLPDWVWLTSMSFNSRTLTLGGKALNNNLLSDFINNLNSSNSFTGVTIGGSTAATEAGTEIVQFTLTCQFVPSQMQNKAG
jgi:Tfp pilus assembly protein PilN